MKFFESEVFVYKNNKLYCEQIPVDDVTESVGTPVYLYSKNYFVSRYREFADAFKEINHSVYYSVKSNFNLNVIKIFYDRGSSVDVNSEGELFRALKAGVNPGKIIFTGVGKTRDEIKSAIVQNVKLIKAESLQEVYLIDKIAGDAKKKVEIAIRVNPDVDPKTHPYISTGLLENKFGVHSGQAVDLFLECSKLKNIELTGIDMHIGSQILSIDPYSEAVDKLSEIYFELKSKRIKLKHFDVGGGLGITYNDENPFSIRDFAKVLIPKFQKLDCDIWFEPGRYLTANGGILLTKILYEKRNDNKNFIIVDAAMTDLIRPSIYGAYHHIQPVELNGKRKEIVADIVGPVCESGDFLAKSRGITETKPGELLAVMSAGAYGMTMASNYNARRKAPEVIVDGDKLFVTRGRESLEHLLFDEDIITALH